ncbi:class I SAM-dependent methyltransferase [Amycolatopsis panacis]|uniref:Class I SAM-dependent methyltransferase n=2 Tax=Amycolatopsis panacis TaxID=2340917 RepID=A0A419I9S2_9PSEU|nr:class I SAM-dependent methyltransferase [Amycolatopsis panacis]
MGAMSAHTHDHIDWADRLAVLRAADGLDSEAQAAAVARLVAQLPNGPTVVDLGCGAGGVSTHFARELAARDGGTIVLADATPELLGEAERAVRAVAGPPVEVRAVRADLADAELPARLPAADLVWASRVVHHLPDQQAAVATLAATVRPGGIVALAEGGLSFACLPWDLGLGRPGLEDRLRAAQAEWFAGMREGIDGSVPMPYGWPIALKHAGLTGIGSFSVLVDHPAPGPDTLPGYLHHHLSQLAEHAADLLTDDDRSTLAALLDPAGPHHLANRRDLYLLGARTVHYGRRA